MCAEDELGHIADVKVLTRENESGEPRARAHLKASPAFVAALRAEARAAAREAAREEMRSRVGRRVAVNVPAAPINAGHLRVRRSTSAEQLASFVRLLRTTWAQGGPAAVEALLASLPGRNHAAQEVVPAALAQGDSVPVASGAPAANGENGAAEGAVAVAPSMSPIPSQTLPAATSPSVAVVSPADAATPATPQTGGDVAPATGTGPAEARSPAPQTSNGSGTTPAGGVLGGSNTSPSGVLAAQSSTSRSQLPFTGLDVPLIALLGGASLAAGVLLRRLRRDGLH